MTEQLHELAKETTPSSVEVPNSYTGLIVWAVGKWGIGVVFAAFLIPVYGDLKASNHRLAEISNANVQVLTALAAKVEANGLIVQRLDDTLRRFDFREHEPPVAR